MADPVLRFLADPRRGPLAPETRRATQLAQAQTAPPDEPGPINFDFPTGTTFPMFDLLAQLIGPRINTLRPEGVSGLLSFLRRQWATGAGASPQPPPFTRWYIDSRPGRGGLLQLPGNPDPDHVWRLATNRAEYADALTEGDRPILVNPSVLCRPGVSRRRSRPRASTSTRSRTSRHDDPRRMCEGSSRRWGKHRDADGCPRSCAHSREARCEGPGRAAASRKA